MIDRIIKYEHHGRRVSVRRSLKGRHRSHCLCWICQKFFPDDNGKNCKTAMQLYSLCVKCGLVTPVWECPEFAEKSCVTCKHEHLSIFGEPCYSCRKTDREFNTEWESKE